MHQQSQFNAGQVRSGRPHPHGFRSADAHRVHQHDLHAAVDHRARQIARRMTMHGYGQRRRAQGKGATRFRQFTAGVGNIGKLQLPPGRAQ